MRVALWSVLLLAVVVLGWMAYRIAKEPSKPLLLPQVAGAEAASV